ncbi:phage tail protein [Nocardia farcinica]|uniref:Gp37-like protein n=1 Tax=Nocardia farcinica TaxID=37329 RepID=UPI001E2C8C7E|nr:phage tail protein [Nocardia farcinica]
MAWDSATAAARFDALERADQRYGADQTVLVRYWDKYLQEVGEEHNYLTLEFTYVRNAAGGLKMTVPKKDMVNFDHVFKNPDGENATIPITVNTKAFRWDGYITKASVVRDEDGTETVDIEAIHCWNHIATTACWASPFAPILAQFPRHMILFGPVRTLCALYLATNLMRLQSSYWTVPDKWLDAPDWAQVGSALWPIAVVPVDTLRDTSRWGAASARFDMADQLLLPLLDGTGVMLTARFFLPGEDEQPAPQWYYLDRPTVVLETVDKSGVTGFGGTLLTGLVSFFEEFINDTTPVRYPNFNATSEYEAIYSDSGPLGTQRNFPWVWYFENEYSGIGRAEVALHKPLATSVIVGGRSPGWVNAGIEIAMKNLLAWLGLLIGIPGLDSLYQGQLDDVFLAWMAYENTERTRAAGPFAFREHVVTNSSKAFTLDGVMTGLRGLHQTRGYTSKRVTVEDAAPYLLGKDFTLGDQIGFVVGDQIFTDYVTEMTFRDDRESGARWELAIGDGADEEDTLGKAWDRLTAVGQALRTLFTDVGADLDLLIF